MTPTLEAAYANRIGATTHARTSKTASSNSPPSRT
jgi:hypothetical protein